MKITDSVTDRFSILKPIYLPTKHDVIYLEIKPYLQPFESLLAERELRALVGKDTPITINQGYYEVKTNLSEEFLLNRLTYWQRLGISKLVPTLQKKLEFTQSGLEKTKQGKDLHSARRLRYGPHDIHEYRGKFFPQLVRSLVNISGVSSDALILDPMCGSGTTPAEALSIGCNTIAADLNPLSVLISNVKCSIVLDNPERFKRNVKQKFEKMEFNLLSSDLWDDNDRRYLALWFASDALDDISTILYSINKNSKKYYRDFFKVCLSNIIRSISWQKESDLRVRKEIKPYTKGEAIRKFKEEVDKQIDKIIPYLYVLSKRQTKHQFQIRQGNSIDISELFFEYKNSVDLLITSPPYATALPYLDTDRLSLVALGLLKHKDRSTTESNMVGTREITEKQRKFFWELYLVRKSILPTSITNLIDKIASINHGDSVGFRRRNLPALLGKYFLDMYDAMSSARKLMKPGASAFYVVGNNSTYLGNERLEIPTDILLFDLGESAGWTKEDFISMELLVSRDIFKDNRGTSEAILHFKA